MVSTRGIRYKFSEGERVLCYEPDPTKAKVLYDSKVLEVIESKDKRGRRTVEYLIHFQGWNSSWDRCVSEDFVLKDTEENRQLQRDLAEKSQLQLGAYLYRRERKKVGNSSIGTGSAKRSRHGFSDDGSSSSTQPDDDGLLSNKLRNAEGEAGDTDSSSASGSSSQALSPLPHSNVGRANITLPSALRDLLTFDYHLVVKRGRLSRLPATPSAAQILESFVKWYARAGAWHPPRGRYDPPAPPKPDMLDVSCRLNLVREVADGLRVYFDFILRGHLLYKQEQEQYHEVCGKFIDDPEEVKSYQANETEENGKTLEQLSFALIEDDLKSPKIPEYSHLPPDPIDDDNNDSNEEIITTQQNYHSTFGQSPLKEFSKTRLSENDADVIGTGNWKIRWHKSRIITNHIHHESKSEYNDKYASTTDVLSEDNQNYSEGSGRTREGRSATRSGNVARSLGSSGSSLSEGWSRPTQAAPSAPPTTRTPLSLLLDKVAKWQIIPREGTEHLPCRVYGAIHLARLFVKLPDFLNATQMPDLKLKLILKHIDMFTQYLDEHSEWFGEMYYIADNVSRSH